MIILVGPSASGKTILAKELTTKYGFKKFVTSTTRKPRQGEINGLDYNFLGEDTFLKKRDNGDFIEYTFYNGNYYGTEKKLIDDKTVLIVESSGLISFKNSNSPNIVAYYLDIDQDTRIKRMIARGDNENTVKERIIHDNFKFNDSLMPYIDKVIDEKGKDVESLAKEIYEDYIERIKKC